MLHKQCLTCQWHLNSCPPTKGPKNSLPREATRQIFEGIGAHYTRTPSYYSLPLCRLKSLPAKKCSLAPWHICTQRGMMKFDCRPFHTAPSPELNILQEGKIPYASSLLLSTDQSSNILPHETARKPALCQRCSGQPCKV